MPSGRSVDGHHPREFPYGPLASSKGSELCAPILKVVHQGVIVGLSGFRIKGPILGDQRIYIGHQLPADLPKDSSAHTAACEPSSCVGNRHMFCNLSLAHTTSRPIVLRSAP